MLGMVSQPSSHEPLPYNTCRSHHCYVTHFLGSFLYKVILSIVHIGRQQWLSHRHVTHAQMGPTWWLTCVTAMAMWLLLHSWENNRDESTRSIRDDVSDEVVDVVSDDSSVRRTVGQRQRRRCRTRTIYLASKYKGCVKKEEKKRKR